MRGLCEVNIFQNACFVRDSELPEAKLRLSCDFIRNLSMACLLACTTLAAI